MTDLRARLVAELNKPIGDLSMATHGTLFDPWGGVIEGIYGGYSSESDDLMIKVLEAVWYRTTIDLIAAEGFAAEFMLYVLAGHGLIEYGTSPRGGWPDPTVADLWQPLIDKWKAYATAQWETAP